jgi:hypothetical protein
LVDAAAVQVISAADEQWIHPFTGLQPRQFRKLVRLVADHGGDAIADGRTWSAVGPEPVRSGADGRRLLAHQPDHAPDRATAYPSPPHPRCTSPFDILERT